MEPKYFSTMTNQTYISIWSKYRPAILQLMVAAEGGPQQYKLFDHEFKALNAKEKSYAFEFQAFQGKAVKNIKSSENAQDLLSVLNMSRKATELMGENKFEFSLDRKFILRISRVEVEVAE